MSVDKMMSVVRTELGYIEGSDNATKYGKAYGADHESWCAMFLWWCGRQAGEDGAVGKYAYCPYYVNHWKGISRWTANTRELERGQIIFWDWNLNGSANHVEIVESVPVDKNGKPTSVITIGGNTGPNSDRVYRNHRDFSYFLGAGRPLYSDWATSWIGKLLVKGSTNSAVTRMQNKLTAKRIKTTPDGVFGPNTLNSVKTFQKENHLTVDGIVGPDTWRKLFA